MKSSERAPGEKNPSVDGFLRKADKWREEMAALRAIVLDCGLTEDMKWRIPCYTLKGGNIVAISGLKEYCALSFFKGALLKDPEGLLVTPGENTRSGRLVRFTSVADIAEKETALKALIHEAIEAEKAGLTVDFAKDAELEYPEELQNILGADGPYQAAFEALTPGRRRAYLLHFAAPKQSKTRVDRIQKCRPLILEGKGMHDDYAQQHQERKKLRKTAAG